MQLNAFNPGSWQDKFDFNQAVEVTGVQRTVYCAGQISCDGEGRLLHVGDMEGQFNMALDNLEAALRLAGMTLANVVRLNYCVTDVPAFLEAVPKVGVRLKAAGCKPASTLLGVVRLAQADCMIELEATACA